MTIQILTPSKSLEQTSTVASHQSTAAPRAMQLLQAHELRAVVGGPMIKNGGVSVVSDSND